MAHVFDSMTQNGVANSHDQHIYGAAIGLVINNLDSIGEGRVQLQLPWLPGYEPWARVAVLSAGMSRGTYFIPQVGDEVLVIFNHGDIREPYVIGSLWNTTDRPPALLTTDPVNKRIIRTPLGHQIEFEDLTQTITVTTLTQQKITMDPTQIELSTTGGTAKITLDVAGNVKIEAALSIELKAATIKLEGMTTEIKGGANLNLEGGGACMIKGGVVMIN
jgi:uncharacterized protein involved in type VI secretion and phage assembly